MIEAVNIKMPGIYDFIESRLEAKPCFPLLTDGNQYYPISQNVLFYFSSFDSAEKKKKEEYGAAIMHSLNTQEEFTEKMFEKSGYGKKFVMKKFDIPYIHSGSNI